MTRALLLLVLLAAMPSRATHVFVSGADGADLNTTNTDSLEFEACGDLACSTGPSTDGDIDLSTTTPHDGTNGGSTTSKWAVVSAPGAASRVAYYRRVGLGPYAAASFGVSVYVQTAPSAGTSGLLAAIVEDDGDFGCGVLLDSARQLTLVYAGGPSLGSCPCGAEQACVQGECKLMWGTGAIADPILAATSCSTDRTVPCASASDCPSPGSASCNGQYYAGVDILQTRHNATSVQCDLKVDGRVLFSGTIKTTATAIVGNVVGFASAALPGGTPNRTWTVRLDDFVLDSPSTATERAGWGYIDLAVPNAAPNPKTWGFRSGNSCSSSVHLPCVTDYATSPFTYYSPNDNNLVETDTVNEAEEFGTQTAIPIPAAGLSVASFSLVAFGSTNANSGTRDLRIGLRFGDAGGALSSSAMTTVHTGAGNQTPRELLRHLVTAAPVAGSSALAPWLNATGVRIESGPAINAMLRVGALATYVAVRRPDPIGQPWLRDHNAGTEDGKVTLAFIADSLGSATVSVTCVGGTNVGQTCTYQGYASWDEIGVGFRDLPIGGCGSTAEFTSGTCTAANTNDVCDQRVKTCLRYRAYFNSGAGLRCDNGSGGYATGACDLTCTAGFCANADTTTAIACTTEADCDFGDGDGVDESTDCDTAATCIENCPGSYCPVSLAGWQAKVPDEIPADAMIQCTQGGESSAEMVRNRFDGIVQGAHATCSALTGSGACQCTAGTAAADCGSGGTCTDGVCTAGDAARLACTANSGCNTGAGRLCQFPRPDYLLMAEWVNDAYLSNTDSRQAIGHDPACTGWYSHAYRTFNKGSQPFINQPQAGCPTWGTGPFTAAVTPCTRDADCTAAVSSDSTCDVGWSLGSGTTSAGCVTTEPLLGSTTCSVASMPCGPVGTTCGGASGGGGTVCGGDDAGTTTVSEGLCRCTSNAGCPSGWSCVGDSGRKLCRKNCATDGDCNASRSSACADVDGTKVCQGRCTIPAASMSCTQDSDCAPPGGTILTTRWADFLDLKAHGTCNPGSGKCWCTGPVMIGDAGEMTGGCSCSADGDCPSGTCDTTRKVCASGTRAACERDKQCARGHRCLRCSDQYRMWHPHHALPGMMTREMVRRIDALGDATPPVLVIGGIPMPFGLTPFGVSVDDLNGNFAGVFYDRNYNWSVMDRVLDTGFPKRRTWDYRLPGGFDDLRMARPCHIDAVHLTGLCTSEIADEVAAPLKRMNVCVAPASNYYGVDPQFYCRNADLTFTSTACATDTDCPSGKRCFPRRCDQNDANCPAAGDTCGGD